MNALYNIHKYLEIKGGRKPSTPLTFIFGAKAEPAYVIAQDIILSLIHILRQDFYSISSRAVEEVHQLMNGGEGHQVIMPHSIVKMYYKDIIC